MPTKKLMGKGIAGIETTLVQEDFWDALTPGLHLRVSGSTGRKTWLVRFRAGGKHRRLKLGVYPMLDLAGARTAAREVLAKAQAGEDPAQERKERRDGARTFRVLAEEVLAKRASKGRGGVPTRQRTQDERRRLLDREILPEWGEREVSSITRRDVVQLVERIAERGAPVLANRTLSLIHLIFNDGIRRDFPTLETNPAHLVEPPGVEKGRDRYLKAKEIRKIWEALDAETVLPRGAFRLALLTAQRIGSILALRWDGIETNGSGALWTIPQEHFKGKRTHLVPLSPEALEVVKELKEHALDEVWVFPSRAKSALPYIGNMTSTTLARVRKRAGVPHWTAHDFRTSFRTWATRAKEDGGLGIDGPIADAVLGHKEGSLGFGRYTGDKERYLLAEKRAALIEWGAWVTDAVTSE